MNQIRSNPAGLPCFDAPLANWMCAGGSCALIGRFLPQLPLWFVCIVKDSLFCKGGFGLNITSKETHLPLLPPPVASLQKEKLLSPRACCAMLGLAPFFLFEGFFSGSFCSRMFVRVSINIRQVSVQRCWTAGLQQNNSSMQQLSVFHTDTKIFFVLVKKKTKHDSVQVNEKLFVCKWWWTESEDLNENERVLCGNKLFAFWQTKLKDFLTESHPCSHHEVHLHRWFQMFFVSQQLR